MCDYTLYVLCGAYIKEIYDYKFKEKPIVTVLYFFFSYLFCSSLQRGLLSDQHYGAMGEAPLSTLASNVRMLFECWLFCFQSSYLTVSLIKQQRMPKGLGLDTNVDI